MPSSSESGHAALRAVGLVAAIVAGFLLALFLVRNPMEIAGLTRWSERLMGHTAPEEAEEEGLWTCGMHPQVVEDHPGSCPICQMSLVPRRGEPDPEESAAGDGERRVLFYRNPMDPAVTSPVPMQDSMGMDYVPVYEDETEVEGSRATVSIDPSVVQNMGVVTERVVRRDVERGIRTVGYLGFDQEKMVTVTTKYQGFVEQVYVNYIGQPVTKGDSLFEVYSPELVQTEQEFLSALEFASRMEGASPEVQERARSLVEAARSRLEYWDVSPDQIERLEDTRRVFRTLSVFAPGDGVVMKRMHGLEGMAVSPGMDVIHIADLSSLWLSVEVFEDQLAWLKAGSEATVTLAYFPGKVFTGRVRFVEPEVSEATRTVKLTLEVPNPGGILRSGMYATVEFSPVVASHAVVVPSHAVLRTGRRSVVIVALGSGRFQPREIELGPEGRGWVQVLSGLEEGEEIVVSSQFLIDSESSLREALQKMLASGRSG